MKIFLKKIKRLKKEIKDGVIPDPATLDPATGLPLPEDPMAQGGGDLGQPVMEPEVKGADAAVEADGSAAEIKKMPKGGEI